MNFILRIKEEFHQRNALTDLETSWDIRKTIHKVRKHKWQKYDLLHVFEFAVLVFCFSIMTAPVFARILAMSVLLLAISIPITAQFFFPALPILAWVILFFSCRFIPHEWRPRIYVRVLPALETILYGGNLSNVLSSRTYPILDILAWIPYGLIHFGGPFVLAAVIFVFAPPKTLPVFGFAFGWMNLIGLTIQILFPTAPPWYQNLHGLEPANYSMPGSPGGLARVDKILGLNMYTGSFTASPQVFGAFPSLHSGSAVMEALFLSYLFPRFTPLIFTYVLWIWWCTMYLTHHYFVDLIGGAVLSFAVFYAVKRSSLPRIQFDKLCRWSYDFIETGDEQPVKFRKSIDLEYELPLYNTTLGEPKYSTEAVVASSPSRSGSRMATLPPILTDLENQTPTGLAAKNLNLHHSHNKSSSYNLYDSEIYPTSASSSNNNSISSSSSNTSTSNSGTSTVNSNASSSTPATNPSSPALAPSSSSVWSLSSNHSLSRPMSTSPVDDGKKSVFFNRINSPSHRD